MQISYNDFKYWEFCDLKKLEINNEYPPRFRIYCTKTSKNTATDLLLNFDVIKESGKDSEKIGGFFVFKRTKGKSLISY